MHIPRPWIGIRIPLVSESQTQSRAFKMLPHLFFEEHSISVWIDGNLEIREPAITYLKFLDDGPIAASKHPYRDCLYEEGMVCIKRGKDKAEKISAQLDKYSNAGFPRNFGLTENSVLIRKHLDASVIKLMETWWSEFYNGSKRDQLSLAFAEWKTGVRIVKIPRPFLLRASKIESGERPPFVKRSHRRKRTAKERIKIILKYFLNKILPVTM